MNRATVLRSESPLRRGADWISRHAPVVVMVLVAALFAAQQTVAPARRSMKAAVMIGLIGLMLRYDMVYSVYLFTLLFVFPSGISIGSTNTVLMTVIPALWLIRATSTRSALVQRTPVDWAIIAYLLAHVISLYAVSDAASLGNHVGVLWKAFTACAFFYTIVTFINTEQKLMRMGKIMCIACALVMLTAVVELFAPGTVLIPGWISLSNQLGEGELSYRVRGLRVGGAFASHGMLADFGTQLILFMVFFSLRARNPAEKAFWLFNAALTFTAVMSTGNRGATTGLALAVVLALAFFRTRIGTARTFMIAALAAVGLVAFDTFLSEHTLAVSIFDRFQATEFEGVVPDTRTMTWKPALELGLEKPFIGHGPYFDVGVGLTKRFWPHNGYLYYFCTLGLVGLGVFMWVVWAVYRQSRTWRIPAVRMTPLGDFMAISQIWFFVLLLEQLRTDHQRDYIYPYIVWMCFGVIVAGALIARRKLAAHAAEEPASQPGNRSMRSVTSMKS